MPCCCPVCLRRYTYAVKSAQYGDMLVMNFESYITGYDLSNQNAVNMRINEIIAADKREAQEAQHMRHINTLLTSTHHAFTSPHTRTHMRTRAQHMPALGAAAACGFSVC